VARIPLPDPDDIEVDPAVREVLSVWKDPTSGQTARIPNVIRAMANHPPLMRDRGIVYTSQARITPRQRELAYLTASVVNSCHY
jgi:alkylhydroperoxidase family enzyme